MTFTKEPTPKGYDVWAWYSGIYKIASYPHVRELYGKRGYYAYYKPEGWSTWGNHVNKEQHVYSTLAKAKQACKDHAEGGNP